MTRLRWGLPDPSSFAGSHADKLAKTRQVRDAIRLKIEQRRAEMCGPANPW